jgi:hypothetical protein
VFSRGFVCLLARERQRHRGDLHARDYVAGRSDSSAGDLSGSFAADSQKAAFCEHELRSRSHVC